MTDYEKEYIDVLESIKKSNDKINTIENTDIFRLYKLFINERKQLEEKKDNLYEKIMFEKFDKCKHYAVKSRYIWNGWGDKGTICHGCIKCGLDNSVFEDIKLEKDMKIMKKYFEQHKVYDFAKVHEQVLADHTDAELSYINGFNNAKEFYGKIAKTRPDITNKELEQELIREEQRILDETGQSRTRK